MNFHSQRHPAIVYFRNNFKANIELTTPVKNLQNVKHCDGGRTGLVVRASDSGSVDPGSILGQVGVLFP